MIRLVIYARETFELDTYGDENIAITYNIDDITNVESKFGNYSKTFDLPATKNNNKFFKQLYNLQSDVSQFDTLKGHKCQLYSNDISIFEGLLYLNEIVKVETETKYRVNLVGETIRFIESLGDATISDLEFLDLTHEFTISNVNASGSSDPLVTIPTVNPTGTTKDIYYSWVQNGGIIGNSSGEITSFSPPINVQPFIKLKNIVDKIFDFAGFTLESNFLDNILEKIFMDTGLDDRRVRADIGKAYRNISADASNVVSTETIDHLFLDDGIHFPTTNVTLNTTTNNFTFDNVHTITTSFTEIPFNEEPTFNPMTVSQPANDVGNILTGTSTTTLNAPAVDFTANVNMAIRVFATPGIDITLMARETTSIGGTNDFILNTTTIPDLADTVFGTTGADSSQPLVYHNVTVLSQISISANSTMQFFIKKSSGTAFISRYEHNFGLSHSQVTGFGGTFNDATDPILQNVVKFFYKSTNANSVFKSSNSLMNLRLGGGGTGLVGTANINWGQANFIHINPTSGVPNAMQVRLHDNHGDVKLADIIKDLFKMFNLVCEQNGQKLKIEPFNDFMQTGTTKDWSKKIDSKEIVQNYEQVPSKITWKYNNDKDDARLTKYFTETGQEYGSMVVQMPVDYVKEQVIKLDVFSAMVFEQNSSGLRYPTCYANNDGTYEQISNNPRLIFKQPHKVLSSINSQNTSFSQSFYRVGSHFEDYPDQMHIGLDDLNFGYTTNLFIATQFSQGNNLYLKYWYDYIQQRFTNDRVLVKAKVYLTETDIQNFSFADTIIIDNQNYNVVKIEYNAGKKGLAKIEMLKK
tara:strand:- start:6477 stop:8903 length:2427 start_codon:yes stop_codon:yes gene_type:complete